MLRLPGAILAGGQSRRMGRDKAFLDIGGKPMIKRTCDVLHEVCSEVMIVGGSEERYSGFGVPWHSDLVSDCGPLGGIYTALKLAGSDVFVAACDLPNLSSDLIRFLILQYDPSKAGITIARLGETLQPLLGVYSSSYLPVLGAFLERGGRSVQQFVYECPSLIVSLESANPPFSQEVLLNVNTPEEYRNLTRT